MAFLKKPLKWTALGQEPSELKKSEGFKMDESPAPGHFDFMFRSTYEAIEELQQKAGEVKTVNNVQPDVNGNVLITLPDTSKLYQKPSTGIPKVDLESSVQSSLEKADNAAPTTELVKTNQALTTHKADLVSQESGKGASLIGINDIGNKFTATTVEGALGELFQFANDGKTSIATVVGSPTLSNDTFPKIKNDIQIQKNNLATNLTKKGQSSVGTETLKSLVDKVVNINTGLDCSLIPSDVTIISSPTEKIKSYSTPTKFKEITINLSGTIRVVYSSQTQGSTSAYRSISQIYVNGSPKGTACTTQSLSYVTYTEDIVVSKGDKIQLYAYVPEAGYSYIKDFKVNGSLVANDYIFATVTLD